MSEIEARILNIDVDEVRNKLIDLGAVLVKKENQINYFYDFPGDTLKQNFKGYCRIRHIDNLLDGSKKYELCVKKVSDQTTFKQAVEEETEVSEPEAAKRILLELGLYNNRTSKKYRESYRLNDALYELDQWEKSTFPVPYLEVEAKDEIELKKAIELIGFSLKDNTSKTIWELREEMGLSEK